MDNLCSRHTPDGNPRTDFRCSQRDRNTSQRYFVFYKRCSDRRGMARKDFRTLGSLVELEKIEEFDMLK